jgi:hypothetical protein
VLGSPAYIAPERARDGTAGPAADMWSLGATLYAAVEGASPFARSSAIATLAALATENPPPARNAGPLKPVLNGLLRKDPTHRINAEEAERLLLRAAGRKSKLTFPMSPTMRRPGVGRERPAYQAGPPIIPGTPTAAGSAPVVPGPRPPVTSGRPPVPPGRTSGEGRPPVTPSGPPITPGRTPASDDGRPPVFTPGKASLGRAPRPAETRLDTPAVGDDQDFSGTGYGAPTSTPEHGALAKGTRGTYGTITPGAAAQQNAASDRTAEDEEAQRDAAAREAAAQATKEREAAERRAAAEREAAKQRQAAERAAAEREAAERAAAEREAAERAAAEREAAERAAAEREAAERAAAEREAAERAAAEREAAERAHREAQQREAAELAAAAERQTAGRDAEARQAGAESDVDDGTAQSPGGASATSPTPAAGGPLIHTDSETDEDPVPETTADESSVDHAARKAAANKPVVGARAGAHTSKAARKKGRGRTGIGGARTEGLGATDPAAAATPAVDSGPAPAASASDVNTVPQATTDLNAETPIATDSATDAAAAEALAETETTARDDAAAGTYKEAPPDPVATEHLAQPDGSDVAQAATDHPAEEDEEDEKGREGRRGRESAGQADSGTVVPMRASSDDADQSAGAPRGSKTKTKVAAARSGSAR